MLGVWHFWDIIRICDAKVRRDNLRTTLVSCMGNMRLESAASSISITTSLGLSKGNKIQLSAFSKLHFICLIHAKKNDSDIQFCAKLLSKLTSVWLLDRKHSSILYLCTSLSSSSFTSFSPQVLFQLSLLFFIFALCFLSFLIQRKKESFSADVKVADGHLVSVPPASSQLEPRDKLWRLHSALLQCRSLLERAIAKEEEEFGGGKKGEYETQRKMVKERLSLLIDNTGELLKAADGTAVPTPNLEGSEVGADVMSGVVMMLKELDRNERCNLSPFLFVVRRSNRSVWDQTLGLPDL